MIKIIMAAWSLFLFGCGDVHEIAPEKRNVNLKQSMQGEHNLTDLSVKKHKKTAAVPTKIETAPLPKKEKIVKHSKSLEHFFKKVSTKEANLSKPVSAGAKSVAIAESNKSQLSKFQNAYKIAEKRIQKDILVAKIDKNTTLALARIDAEKTKILKSKELESSLLSAKLQNSIKEKEIAASVEKSKIDKLIKEQELSNKMQQLQLQNALSLQEQKNRVLVEHEKMALYKLIMIVVASLILIGLFVLYFINKRNRETKLKLQEEEILKERQMQLLEHQNARINKMLDIVSKSENLSKNVEKELLGVIKDAGRINWMIDDGRGKRKGIIFKN